ncbi:MAG TPA: DUF6599 family protein [Bryobacteraceae bacterium]|nr:DUF6599 family protein [Bryobacteraceae bacterium]
MKYWIALLFPALAAAAIWPESVGQWHRVSAEPVTLSDRQLWDEYGFQEAETARFEGPGKKFTATAWRLQDSTAALGAFEWQRPADAKPSKAAELAVKTKDGVLLASGNYLIAIDGEGPSGQELADLIKQFPRMYQAQLPALPGYMPTENLVPNSSRYIVGPAGLARFESRIPPSVAAFHYGVEASLADFRAPGGEMRLVLFYYPTPQIAIQQYDLFAKLPGAVAKRSGPVIAVVMSPPNADAAEHLLSRVRYQASITMSEYVPTRRDNVAHMILTIFELTGILLVFSLVAGLAFGGLRAIMRRLTKNPDGDAMIVLDLSGHRQ